MKIDAMKRISYFLLWGWAAVALSACGGSFQTAGMVAQGRQDLFKGNNQVALGYFQEAVQADPNYVWGNDVQEGVMSYLGRAQYHNGQFAQARQSLQSDLAQRPGDYVARLYLGLTLVSLGERQQGLPDIEAGMKSITSYLNSVSGTAQDFRRYLDPYNAIRDSIAKSLAQIATGNIDWSMLNTCGAKIANAYEQAPDNAQIYGMQAQPYDLC
jgi:tetratricopeptide (TPR) repeat protein